jgi:hypothetical protein
MEEVNETQEEEVELRERNAMAQVEEKMMGNKRGMHIADTLDEIRIRNAQMEKGGRGRVEGKSSRHCQRGRRGTTVKSRPRG